MKIRYDDMIRLISCVDWVIMIKYDILYFIDVTLSIVMVFHVKSFLTVLIK